MHIRVLISEKSAQASQITQVWLHCVLRICLLFPHSLHTTCFDSSWEKNTNCKKSLKVCQFVLDVNLCNRHHHLLLRVFLGFRCGGVAKYKVMSDNIHAAGNNEFVYSTLKSSAGMAAGPSILQPVASSSSPRPPKSPNPRFPYASTNLMQKLMRTRRKKHAQIVS